MRVEERAPALRSKRGRQAKTQIKSALSKRHIRLCLWVDYHKPTSSHTAEVQCAAGRSINGKHVWNRGAYARSRDCTLSLNVFRAWHTECFPYLLKWFHMSMWAFEIHHAPQPKKKKKFGARLSQKNLNVQRVCIVTPKTSQSDVLMTCWASR